MGHPISGMLSRAARKNKRKFQADNRKKWRGGHVIRKKRCQVGLEKRPVHLLFLIPAAPFHQTKTINILNTNQYYACFMEHRALRQTKYFKVDCELREYRFKNCLTFFWPLPAVNKVSRLTPSISLSASIITVFYPQIV